MACSLALAVRGGLSLHKDIWSLGVHPVPLRVRLLRSRWELEYSLTLQTLYAIAAQSRRDRPFSVCSCASGLPRQCHKHQRRLPSSLFASLSAIHTFSRPSFKILLQDPLKDHHKSFIICAIFFKFSQFNVVFSHSSWLVTAPDK